MRYDFTSVTNRKATGSDKWNLMYQINKNVDSNILPLSVADMEFKTAPEIREGLKSFLDDNILGYTSAYDSFLTAVVNWQERRHDWQIEKEWIVNTTGVVGALNAAIKAVSNEGDGIIYFPVAYPPFSQAIHNNQRQMVPINLINEADYYTIDFLKFEEEAAKANNKALLFCNPHNPIGRVWTVEELEKIAEIALKYNLYIISDDIWNDIVMPNHTYTPLATLNDKIAHRTITCTSSSKSFNIAGLCVSNIIISNDSLRQTFKAEVDKMQIGMVNVLGYKACEIAYNEAEGWLDQLLEVIDNNQKMVCEFIREECPILSVNVIEGTYVQWLNCQSLEMTDEELDSFMFHKAQFFTSPGYAYGSSGSGYHRINLALPPQELQANLERLKAALESLKS